VKNRGSEEKKAIEVQPLPIESIQQRILEIRGLKVIIDSDLARFYGVSTKRLNEQVKRNPERFPDDFMFEITKEEKNELVAKCDHLKRMKFSSFLPNVFTEHGAIMAASVLSTARASQISVFIVRAFVSLRNVIQQNKEIMQRLTDLERASLVNTENIESIIQFLGQAQETEPPRIGF